MKFELIPESQRMLLEQNGVKLFGYQIGQEDKAKEAKRLVSFAPPQNDDGAIEIAPGGSYGTFVDLEGKAKSEAELVTRYRELALQLEVEAAVDDIVNEAIIIEDHKNPVEINLDDVNLPTKIKTTIVDEFREVLRLLDFNKSAYDIFKRWYVDGRLYYHMMIDEKKPREGVKELRYIDPRRIRKVREPVKKAPVPLGNQTTVPGYNEYYIYMYVGMTGTTNLHQGIKISKDSICYVHSGMMDQRNTMVLSHLHKAIKAMNQLRMLEDAVVIYRLARAPERRVFYIDVGNLPKMKAEQYLRDMMIKHKNRLVYDAATGEIRDDRKFMTMLEDFWLPRREGGRGTEVTNLPGGQTLGQLEDVEYFQKKLYKALNVPISRLQSESTFNFGRASEITRDEIKFSRMIDRLRVRFTALFNNILETQLLLKGVMSRDEWKQIKESIKYDFLRDNYFSELKDQEIINARLGILQTVDQFVGKYFSQQYIMEKVLKMTEEEIEEMKSQIQQEMQEQEQEGQMIAPGPTPQSGPIQPQGPVPGGGGAPQGQVIPKPPPKPLKEIRIRPRSKELNDEVKSLVENMKTEVVTLPK